jgi:hypothetical protein
MVGSECCWKCPEQWSEWSEWLAAGLHARNRWRLPVLLVGMLFAGGRRTVTTWLRAARVSDDFQDYYYCLAALGRKTDSVATRLITLILRTLPLPDRLLLVIDDSPTKRYGPKVEALIASSSRTGARANRGSRVGRQVGGRITWATKLCRTTTSCRSTTSDEARTSILAG